MSRNAAGVYTLPDPPVVTLTSISSTDENTTRNDMATELTSSLDRSGRGGMLTALSLVDGSAATPGLIFGSDVNTGAYHSAADVWNLVAGGISQANIAGSGLNITNQATVTRTAGGDTLRLSGLGAGSGANIDIVNGAQTDYEPLIMILETLAIKYRTGAGTAADALNINTAGQVVPAIGILDSGPLVSGSADVTKKFRLEVDGLTTATTRVGTVPDYNVRLGNLPAGIGPLPYAGSSVPTGWLYCDGSAVSRTTYADLFTAISTNWGVGDGSTTFNLPDMRGRAPIGDGTGTVVEVLTSVAASGNGVPVASNTDKWITGDTVVTTGVSGFTGTITNATYFVSRISPTNVRFATTLALAQNGTPDVTVIGTGSVTMTITFTARTLAQKGGQETHAISSTEMLSHLHTQGTHSHTTSLQKGNGGSGGDFATGLAGGATAYGSSADSAGAIASFGGNAAMNTMQPFAVVKYIISY